MLRLRSLISATLVLSSPALAIAQSAPAKKAPAPRLVFWVTTTAWADGAEIPMRHAFRGDNKSPAFTFRWNLGTDTAAAPDTLKTYAVIFHDVENSTNKTTTDTLHWTAFNIPGTANGIPEGLGSGDLPDGTRNGPGLASRGGNPPAYFGPGAGPGPLHHYVFEFYALDTKLDLPANTTREDLLKAMDGHVLGKSAWFGRFHTPTP
jgi:Raf kinase inhibitor-like YbhB/YbcL family protein